MTRRHARAANGWPAVVPDRGDGEDPADRAAVRPVRRADGIPVAGPHDDLDFRGTADQGLGQRRHALQAGAQDQGEHGERARPRFADVLDPADTNCNILADNGHVDGDREPRPTNDGRRMHIQRKGGNDKPIWATQERRNTALARSTRGSRSPDRQHQSM
jgi:hypothetical protein